MARRGSAMRLAAALVPGLLLAPLHAHAQTCHITVTVDAEDGPVAAALVRLFDRRRVEVATGKTDGEGRLTVDVRSRWYRVYVSAPGYVGDGVPGYSSADVESIEG